MAPYNGGYLPRKEELDRMVNAAAEKMLAEREQMAKMKPTERAKIDLRGKVGRKLRLEE
jgi:hypothetical protein